MNRSTTWPRRGKQVLIIVFWVLVWEAVCLIINKEIYFPSPASAGKALISLLAEGETWFIVGSSAYRTLLALVLSAVSGIGLGVLCGLRRGCYDLFNPLVVVLRSTPVVSIIIIAIIWFRSTNVPIFAGFLMCFPMFFTGTVAGIRSTDPRLLEMCRVYRVGRWHVVSSVYFRSALPYINASAVSSMGICWKAVAAAEVLSIPKYAIGSNLFFAKTNLDPASLFAWTMIIIFLSYLFETVFVRISGYDKTGKR